VNPLLLVRCVRAEGPPPFSWALLASRAAAAAPCVRIQAHPLGLGALAAELRAETRGPGVPLVVLDTEFPVAEAAAFVAAIAPQSCLLHGPYALDRFEQLPVRAALVGPGSADLPGLLSRWAAPSGIDDGTLLDHPGLLVRQVGPDGEGWTATPQPGWPTLESARDLDPSALEWSYRGPEKHRSSRTLATIALRWPESFRDFVTHEEREAAGRARSADERKGELPPPDFDARWSAGSPAVLRALLAQDPSARLFQFAPPSRREAVDLLVDEILFLGRLGHRSLAVSAADPSPILLTVLRELERRSAAPIRLVLSPSVTAVRRVEGMRQEILAAAHLVEHLVVDDVAFHGFDDRGLGDDGRPGTHWDQRWVARLLAEVEAGSDGRISATRGHRLSLIDPFTRPPDLVAALAAIDEDGSFLKPLVHPGAFLPVPSRHGTLGRRIAAAALLRPARTVSGWGYELADPRLRAYLDRAQQGLGPLLESIGRLKLDAETRAQAVVEARFRWMRQLAEHFEHEGNDDGENWGKVLAAVTREIAVQMRRS
jgi:hypothetical protein